MNQNHRIRYLLRHMIFGVLLIVFGVLAAPGLLEMSGLSRLTGHHGMPGAEVYAAASKDITGTSRFDYSYKVLEKVNAARAKEGKAALQMDKDLLEAAMCRAAEIAVDFNHNRPNGELCFTLCDKIYAENIAYGQDSPDEVVNAWLNSSGHRTNLMNSTYKSIGVGCFECDGTFYWAQSFGIAKADEVKEPDSGESTYRISLTAGTKTKLISGAGVGASSDHKEDVQTTEDAQTTEGSDISLTPLASKVSGFKVKAGKKKLTLTWEKKSGVTGYQVQVSNKSSFKNAETYTLAKGKKKLVVTQFGNKKLKSKKKYYVRIRAYIETVLNQNAGSGSGTDNAVNTISYSAWKKISKKTK